MDNETRSDIPACFKTEIVDSKQRRANILQYLKYLQVSVQIGECSTNTNPQRRKSPSCKENSNNIQNVCFLPFPLVFSIITIKNVVRLNESSVR